MIENKFNHYMRDLGLLIQERAREVKKEKDAALGSTEADYKIGYLMAFHEIIDLMKQQADAFDIDQREIGLKEINPDEDLL